MHKRGFIALPNYGIGIILTKGYVAEIDASDFHLLGEGNWHAHPTPHVIYARRTGRKGNNSILLHRLINATPEGMLTDHIDGNGLNNRKSNLRTCTSSENQRARNYKSGKNPYRGVHPRKSESPSGPTVFQVLIWINNKTNKSMGRYPTAELAAAAYDRAALHYYGDFAKTNFPKENYLAANPEVTK